jgi:pimeloyl-ACP methyl ester carboxylesterase
MLASQSASTKHQEFAKKVYRAFLSPSRYETKPADREVIERGRNYRHSSGNGALAVTTWGEGEPAILLMHGWGGGRAQMTGFVAPLVSAGYRVVAYDQPAHGESDGQTTNFLEIAPSMSLVSAAEGNFAAIIAHSFGTLATSYALANQMLPLPARLVYFSAFNRLMESLPRFQAQANLPDEVIDGMRDIFYSNFGRETLEALVHENLVSRLDVPALLFHDVADNVTPIGDSRDIAKAWKSARLIETNGLGHRDALQSRAIHEQVVGFLSKTDAL